jgi:hypothetical protein
MPFRRMGDEGAIGGEKMDTQKQYEEARSPLGAGKMLYRKDMQQADHVSDAVDRYPVIIQNFFRIPVRFFRLNFEVEMHTRKALQTWAIPLADLASSVNYPQRLIRKIILRNLKFFIHSYKIDFARDSYGRYESMILIPGEMMSALTVGIQGSSTKNPKIRERARHFQRWALIVLHMIRTRKLIPVRWIRSTDVDSKYIALLSIPSGRDHKKRVAELAREEGKSLMTIYRRLKWIRGSNIITARGTPRKTRKAA